MWYAEKKGNKIVFGRELTAQEKVKQKLKDRAFVTMSRTEKDELLYDLLVMQGLIDTK